MKILILTIVFISSLFASSNVDIKLGEKLYKETCISCHGVDGRGNVYVTFIVNSRKLNQTILNQEQLFKVIKEGAHHWGAHADIMPAFKYVYDEKELRAVSKYVFKTFNKDVESKIDKLYNQSKKVPENRKQKMLKRGAKIFKRNCSWCHGKNGKGDGEATRNPEKSIFPYDLTKTLLSSKQMFLYTKEGGKFWGTFKDDMPSWKVKYDDYTIKSVIRYINEVIKKGKQK
jgi:mono/diheme cytochrome c family protein